MFFLLFLIFVHGKGGTGKKMGGAELFFACICGVATRILQIFKYFAL